MGTAAVLGVVGVAAAGAIGQAVVGRGIATAQGRAAEAELAEARRTRELALAAAEPSPEEITQLDRAVELNEQDIARKTKLLESADPAIIESGRQALRLLQGEEAKTLDPLRRQRQEDRVKLEDQLRGQLGAGFATSTAGIQALNDFDQGTSSVLAQEQDRSLGRLLGIATQVTQTQGLAGSVARAGTLGGLFGRQQERRVAAIQGTPITPFAGAPFVGDIQRGRTTQAAIGQFTRGATTAITLGSILGGRGGGGGFQTGTPISSAGFEASRFRGVA